MTFRLAVCRLLFADFYESHLRREDSSEPAVTRSDRQSCCTRVTQLQRNDRLFQEDLPIRRSQRSLSGLHTRIIRHIAWLVHLVPGM